MLKLKISLGFDTRVMNVSGAFQPTLPTAPPPVTDVLMLPRVFDIPKSETFGAIVSRSFVLISTFAAFMS
jgi:hypothetical protein